MTTETLEALAGQAHARNDQGGEKNQVAVLADIALSLRRIVNVLEGQGKSTIIDGNSVR